MYWKTANRVVTKNVTIELIRPNSDIRSAAEGISVDVISIQFLLQNEFDPFVAHSKLPQRSHIDVSLTMGWCNMVRFFRSEKKWNHLMTFNLIKRYNHKTYNFKFILDLLTWGIPIIDFDWYIGWQIRHGKIPE